MGEVVMVPLEDTLWLFLVSESKLESPMRGEIHLNKQRLQPIA